MLASGGAIRRRAVAGIRHHDANRRIHAGPTGKPRPGNRPRPLPGPWASPARDADPQARTSASYFAAMSRVVWPTWK